MNIKKQFQKRRDELEGINDQVIFDYIKTLNELQEKLDKIILRIKKYQTRYEYPDLIRSRAYNLIVAEADAFAGEINNILNDLNN